MKTAVSIPDDVFARAERLARGGKVTQRGVQRRPPRVRGRHEPDDVTEAVNRVIEDLGEDAAPDGSTQEAVRQVLESSDW